ncbi:ATP phosphoribosyltransferase [Sanyastnella coralliicola]|uniref:ATP phosphoribosyltransferase n=1 Tax=Sanyastnella coralliicola TaxID=3069118 RepID=UPI003D9C6A80
MSMLKLAIQKKGRLSDKSLALLRDCGIRFSNGKGKLTDKSTNFPIEILYLRDDDIPRYVENGTVHLGIVGENEVLEQGRNLVVKRRLGFAKCRLSLAIRREEEYTAPQDLQGKSIATSYPNILQNYLNEQNIDAQIETISGSVELAPQIGLADVVFDIVSTGSTLLMNGLKEVEKVCTSEALLIANNELPDSLGSDIEELLFRIQAIYQAQRSKYVLLNTPNSAIDAISSILPGVKGPTIMPLGVEDWSSLHAVVPEDQVWDTIGKIKALGAEGILVANIENMVQ